MEHRQLLCIESTLQAALRCVGLGHGVNSGAVLVFALMQADAERAIRVVAEGQAHSGWIAIAIIPPYRYGGNAGRAQPQGGQGVSESTCAAAGNQSVSETSSACKRALLTATCI